MNSDKFISILIFLVLLFSNQIYSQDIRKDLKLYFKAFDDISSFSANLKLSIYSSDNDEETLEALEIEMKKLDNSYYYTIGDDAFLTTDRIELIIYHTQKKIIYKFRNSTDPPAPYFQFLANPDSILNSYTNIEFKGTQNGIKHYRLNHSTATIRTVDLFLDVAANRIKQLAYQYAEDGLTHGEFVIIDFLDMQIDPVIDSKTFAIDQYFLITNHIAKGVAAYQNYDIVCADDF